jgi:DNA-binding LacI/PurR family transcriptional regulator
MSKPAITIRDIARKLGVSKSTVSRALNHQYDVNPETARRVRELAAKMDYEPNLLAQHLKQQRTKTIGVIIPETVNRFFAKAVGGIQEVATQAGYNVIICQSNETLATERNNLQTLMANKVDGLLISVSRETDRYDHLQHAIDKEVPIVFFDRIVEELKASQVYSDNYNISLEGTEHLIEQGCKRIAYVAGRQNLYNSRNRFNGYLAALKKHDMTVLDSLIVHAEFTSGDVADYTHRLLNLTERPDGIFAINDMAAIEMIHIIKKMGLSVPSDIAILGFNNETIGNFIEPSLSSIAHPAFAMGTEAAGLLLKHINQTEIIPEKKLVKSQLIIRESTRREF